MQCIFGDPRIVCGNLGHPSTHMHRLVTVDTCYNVFRDKVPKSVRQTNIVLGVGLEQSKDSYSNVCCF